MIYLDSAAAVKLIHAEADAAALRRFLDQRCEIEWVSSALLEVETYRALVRVTSPTGMPLVINNFHPLLDLISRVEIDPGVRILAQTAAPQPYAVSTPSTWPPPCAFATRASSPRS